MWLQSAILMEKSTKLLFLKSWSAGFLGKFYTFEKQIFYISEILKMVNYRHAVNDRLSTQGSIKFPVQIGAQSLGC